MSALSPARIRRQRTRGWRAPAGAIYVGRGSKWGNPFALRTRSGLARVPAAVNQGMAWEYESRICAAGMQKDYVHPDGRITACTVRYLTPAESVACYRSAILGDGWPVRAYPSRHGLPSLDEIRAELAGKSLMCWCAEDQACHADLLLAWANGWDEPDWIITDSFELRPAQSAKSASQT